MDEFNRHKKSDKIKWIATLVAFLLIFSALGAIIAAMCGAFKDNGDKYELTWANKVEVIENPGKWYYMADGNEYTDYLFADRPMYEDGTVTIAFKSTSDPANNAYQLRYQPIFDVGSKYIVTFTANVSAEAILIVGTTGKTVDVTELEVGKDFEVTYEGVVGSGNPFFIQLKNYDYTKPVKLKITDIVFEEKSEETGEVKNEKAD